MLIDWTSREWHISNLGHKPQYSPHEKQPRWHLHCRYDWIGTNNSDHSVKNLHRNNTENDKDSNNLHCYQFFTWHGNVTGKSWTWKWGRGGLNTLNIHSTHITPTYQVTMCCSPFYIPMLATQTHQKCHIYFFCAQSGSWEKRSTMNRKYSWLNWYVITTFLMATQNLKVFRANDTVKYEHCM